jgi:hypothetical protein
MDKETQQELEKIRRKYKSNKNVEFLFSQLANLEIKLIGADIMAMMVDIAVKRGTLDSRSPISDSRNNYGTPWEYLFASKKLLLEYRGGIEEVQEKLSEI